MNLRSIRPVAIVLPTIAAATMLLVGTATAGTSTTPAARVGTAAAAPNPNTCTFWRATHGPWGQTKAFVNRNLTWTAASNAARSKVTLARNADKLTQCWKLLGGFGNGRFELQLANSSLCLNVAGASRSVGANMILYPCLSQINELFVGATNNNRTQFQSANSGLCVEARGGISAGAVLVQDRCSHFGNWQSWFLQ